MSSLFPPVYPTLAFWSPGPAEMMVLAVVALLLYGGNLPEVARSWGKSFAEFRRGLSGFQNELNEVIYSEPEKIAYQEENYRDDARYANGYEDSDDGDQSEQTAKDAGAEIIAEEDAEEDALEDSEEKPTD